MWYFLEEGFWYDPWLIALFVVSVSLIVFLRYVLFAWVYQVTLRALRKETPDIFKVREGQIRTEIRYAFQSSCVFTAMAAATLFAWHMGWTNLYSRMDEYPLWYYLLSGVIIVLGYETYYYWLHRWMHQPQVFKHIHKVHHRSIQPTVFTSFSFHPLEALLQFAYFPVILIVVPVHYSMLLAVLTLFTISALINHSGQEIYGNANVRRHIIGAGHHEVHHKSFHHNYGLFFTWWDQWMGTNRDP